MFLSHFTDTGGWFGQRDSYDANELFGGSQSRDTGPEKYVCVLSCLFHFRIYVIEFKNWRTNWRSSKSLMRSLLLWWKRNCTACRTMWRKQPGNWMMHNDRHVNIKIWFSFLIC
jgi:hypothetical protein